MLTPTSFSLIHAADLGTGLADTKPVPLDEAERDLAAAREEAVS